jgi:hypothetical protein
MTAADIHSNLYLSQYLKNEFNSKYNETDIFYDLKFVLEVLN